MYVVKFLTSPTSTGCRQAGLHQKILSKLGRSKTWANTSLKFSKVLMRSMVSKPPASCLKIMWIPCVVVDQSVLLQQNHFISQLIKINPVERPSVSHFVGSPSDRNFDPVALGINLAGMLDIPITSWRPNHHLHSSASAQISSLFYLSD